MKMKRFLSIVVTLCMVLSLLPVGAWAACAHEYVAEVYPATCTEGGFTVFTCSLCGDAYIGDEVEPLNHPEYVDGFCALCGSGQPAVENGDYYEISNVAQLYWFAEQVNGGNTDINGKLMNDIVVNENVLKEDGTLNGDGSHFKVWTPIGNGSKKYTGTFDGNGKTVSGLYVNDSKQDYVGLFGYVGNGCVQNVGVVGSYLNGRNDVGGVVGYSYYGTVINCYNTGSVSGSEYVGGVVGYSRSTVSDCYNTGSVSGNGSYVGGVVGYNGYYGTVSNSYNTGSVSGDRYVGGVVGYNNDYSTVSNCYNTGSVSGNERVGGVVGDNYYSTASNSYNTGSVSGTKYVGGVVGYNYYYNTVSNSYNTGSVSGDSYVGGVVGFNDVTATVQNCYYRTGCAKDSSNKIQFGIGCETVGSNVRDTAGITTGKSTDVFASGEVAYLLQGEQTEQIWGQEIGVDPSPVLGGEPVYFINGEYSNKVCQHEYQAVVTQPTCTAGGYTTYTCTGCGESYTGNATNPTGHSWTAANCKNPKTCSACGITEGDLGDHSYTAQITAPGCLTDGFTTHTCTGCGDSYRDSYVLASGHSWVDADCTQPITCTTCGQTWGQPMGHSFGEVTVHKPTPDAQGYSERSCTICGFNEKFDFVDFVGVTVSGQLTSTLAGDTTVELIQNGEVAYSITVSGSEYAIEGVVAGDYTLRVTKANHAPMEFAITVGDGAVTQDATICPVGDVSGDGVVNIKDFQRLLRHVNKTNPLEDYDLACGDVTGDGVCNIKDFQRLLRHVNKTNPLF